MEIKMKVPKGFELEKAVCNHGFFMMAPNRWMPSTKTLVRPLRLRDQLSVTVSISQISPTSLLITIPDDNPISFSHCPYITNQVTRMLRLSPTEEARVKEFHRLHADAAKKGFGRLFRNPSLFEDLIKSLLLCSSSFQKTLEMAEGLCVLQKRLDVKEGLVRNAKRGRKKASDCDEESWGNFPSIEELALLDNKENLLRNNCKLGYRARWVMLLVENVTKGKICLMDLEKLFDGNQLYPILRSFNGFGDFAASNAFMCMGFYDRVPCDTETIRHFKQVHGRIDCDHKNVWAMANERYDMYAPFQALAYWLEMVDYYEINLGKLSLLDRCRYKNVAGTSIDRSSRGK